MLLLEVGCAVLHQPVVEVLTTKMSVTRGGLDFEDAVIDSEQRHIERAAAQIEDEDVALALSFLVESVCYCSSSRLVDDAQYVQMDLTVFFILVSTMAKISLGWNFSHNLVLQSTYTTQDIGLVYEVYV